MDDQTNSGAEGLAWEIIDFLGQGVAIFAEDGRLTYVNAALTQMLGASSQELIAQISPTFTHPDDREKLSKAVQQTLSGQHTTIDIRLNRPDGSLVFAEVTAVPRLKSNSVASAYLIVTDLTTRKEAEEAIRQSEARYRRIVEDQTDFIVRWLPDGTRTFVNDAYCQHFNTSKEEMVGSSFFPLIHEADLAAVKARLAALSPENPMSADEHRSVLPDGSIRWHRWLDRAFFDEQGRIIELQSVGRDITEQKMAEAALRRSQAELQHIIDSVPEGVMLLSHDGTILTTNPIADTFLAILAPDLADGRLLQLGKRPFNELLTSPPKGLWHEIIYKEHTFEAIARPIENKQNDTSWVLVLRDVTQEREIRQQAQRQERLAAVGQLAAGIAHDFNNIMAVIILYSQLLSRTINMSQKAQERLSTIENQALRASDLIQQILDFSRQSLMEQQPLDMLPFMKEIVKLLRRTLPENIQIELLHSYEPYLIQGDPSRIQQLFMNLALNARDAMPDGGKLTIGMANVATKPNNSRQVPNVPGGSWVQIQVADEGGGISPEILPRVFEPFFTTKEAGQGTGLGLAQVYGIVQQHQGYIDVATGVGKGTTFSLYFPALGTGDGEAIKLKDSALRHGAGQTVLLVEDNEAARAALADSLQLLNYTVLEAGNGREALDVLATKENDISLVLSDAVMPKMGGITLFHKIQQRQLKIPVIILTGHPFSDELESLKEVGLAAWMAKPPDLASLSQLLFQVLAHSFPRDNEHSLL